MAVTWNVKNTNGLGTGYKATVKSMADNHGYGSLYEATRNTDSGGMHVWTCKTKKLLGGKYQFTVYTHKGMDGGEGGSGYGTGVSKI